MNAYYQGWKDAIEAATRHAKVATDLAELVEGRLPALLACAPSRPGGFFSTTGELTWTPLSQPREPTPSHAAPRCERCDGTGLLGGTTAGGSCPACGPQAREGT